MNRQVDRQTKANFSSTILVTQAQVPLAMYNSIYLSIGINVRFAAMMADVGDGLL